MFHSCRRSMAGTGTLNPPLAIALSTYLAYVQVNIDLYNLFCVGLNHCLSLVRCSWTVLFIFGHIRDLLQPLLGKRRPKKGYAPIRQSYEDFYTRRMYYRAHVRELIFPSNVALSSHVVSACHGLHCKNGYSLVCPAFVCLCRIAGIDQSAALLQTGSMLWRERQ